VELNGVPHDMVLSGRYETVLNSAGGLTVAVTCTWPAVSLAAGSFRIRKYAVVNVGGLEAQMVGCHGKADWPGFVAAHVPFVTWYEPKKLFLQDNDGRWYQVMYEVSPVERGGTGLASIDNGQLIYGAGGGFVKLDPPASENNLLRFMNGKPQWYSRDELLEEWGALRCKTDSYDGNSAKSRTINLGVSPKVLYIYGGETTYLSSGSTNRVVLLDGVTDQKGDSYWDGSASHSYTASVKLSGSTLTFNTSEPYKDYPANHCNKSGSSYKWVAIY
jgi:hypothetical protein